jgi:hypothetical protein
VGRPSLSATQMAAVLTLQPLHGSTVELITGPAARTFRE